MYPSSSPFHHPPHYITLDDGTIFDELLQLQQHHPFFNNPSANNTAAHDQQLITSHENMGKCSNSNGDDGLNKPESSSKNKRRSASKKIETAQGPRDRRMRLSVDVGQKFFKLQDMLGFDKASKTVEWLLMKSRSKIQELMICKESSTSRCELLCEDTEFEDNENNAKSSCSSNRKGKKKSSSREVVRKSSYPPSKETREMARKRARERTLEKSCKLHASSSVNAGDDRVTSKFTPCLDQAMDQQDQVNHLGSWIINQAETSIIDDNSSSTIVGWNPSFLFNYQHTGVLPDQEHQYNDFEILANLWEAKN